MLPIISNNSAVFLGLGLVMALPVEHCILDDLVLKFFLPITHMKSLINGKEA